MDGYLAPLGGGALIGLAASLVLLGPGRVAGISSIVGDLLQRSTADRAWRLAFLAGLLATGVVAAIVAPGAIGTTPVALPLVVLAGLLVGYGTRLSGGCTSGHGVCGLSRLSPRSLAATITFIATGVLTVIFVQVLGGWS